MHQRYAHARQFKRANKALRKLKTYLGRVIRDITRKIEGDPGREASFVRLLGLTRQVRSQQRGQRGPKVYSLHAPAVECIGKGKAHKPYEFGVKVSVATPAQALQGRPVRRPCAALPGNPYDGHTLAHVIPAIEQPSARRSSGSMRMPATAATMRRPSISSKSTRPGRSVA